MRIALLLPLLALGCASTPDYTPPFPLETKDGIVHAQSETTARATARVLESAPEIRDLLGSSRTDPPVVWVLASSRAHLNGALGVTGQDRIQIGFDALLTLRTVVRHELAHWYIVDSPFDDVPLFIEEGLAEYIAIDMPSTDGGPLPLYMLTDPYRVPQSDLALKTADVQDLPMDRRLELRAAGANIVTRLGLERLRALAERNAGIEEYLAESKRGAVRPGSLLQLRER